MFKTWETDPQAPSDRGLGEPYKTSNTGPHQRSRTAALSGSHILKPPALPADTYSSSTRRATADPCRSSIAIPVVLVLLSVLADGACPSASAVHVGPARDHAPFSEPVRAVMGILAFPHLNGHQRNRFQRLVAKSNLK
jgi:hypothetical protein